MPSKQRISNSLSPPNTRKTSTEAASLEQTRSPLGHGELILLADDDPGIREVTRRILERYGYRVLAAVNGAEEVALYAQHHLDIAVVLTDMEMPVMDGPAAIIALRLINPAVIIIGSSGVAFSAEVARTLQHFLPKPYTAETLLQTLHEILHA